VVSEFLHHMLADDASPASLRSYAYELRHGTVFCVLSRFLGIVPGASRRAIRAVAQDSKKPPRQRRTDAPAPGSVNPVTGKATSGANYAARTRRHARAVIRSFYEYHRRCTACAGQPLPKARAPTRKSQRHTTRCSRSDGRPGERRISQRNPSRPRGASRTRRSTSCSRPGLQPGSGAGRVLHLTGAAPRELLGCLPGPRGARGAGDRCGPQGQPGIAAVASLDDAFVWLRLYQQEMRDLVRRGQTRRCGGRCAVRSGP